MAAQPQPQDDYPYAAQPPAVLRNYEPLAPTGPPRSGPGCLRGCLYASLIGLIVIVLAATPPVIIGYRGARQASQISKLEELGCTVGYNFDANQKGTWGEFLEDTFGWECFGIVDHVDAQRLDTEQDAATVCRICGHFDQLRTFRAWGDGFHFAYIAKWSTLRKLEELEISSTNLTDDDLSLVAEMQSVEKLTLGSPRISDIGIHRLSKLKNLKNMTLTSPQLLGNVPPNERGFPTLRDLEIHDSQGINDEAIIRLGPMPQLEWVELSNTSAGDRALKHLAAAGKLTGVTLSRTQITDDGLAALATCPELYFLYLSQTGVTDAAIVHLANCAKLGQLDCSDTKVTGKGFSALTSIDLALTLDRTAVSDDTIPELLRIPGLRSLSLQGTGITGESIPARRLEALDLSGTALTPAAFQKLATMSIESLTLSSTKLDDAALLLFVNNDTISQLDATTTKITESGLRAFYDARKKRLAPTGSSESLLVSSDFPDVAEQYVEDKFNLGFLMNGQPIGSAGAPLPAAPDDSGESSPKASESAP